ncbi:TonB family protein [Candidatus Fermentibacteria bacterium]|nr:TonB family protein [Candidatus Fermentibacteria bacterium]
MAEIKTFLLRREAPEILKKGVLLSLLLCLFTLLAVPEYKIKIRTMQERKIETLDLPPELTVPQKEKAEVPRPTIPVEAEEDEDVPEDVTIQETILDAETAAVLPTEPPPQLPEFGKFVAYDTKPEFIRYATPDYPEMAKKAGIEGTVLAQLLVGADGKVYDVRVMSGPDIFHEQVKAAALSSLFSPAKQRDKPVAVWVAVPYRFSLRDAR